jgi:hypothetical protein
MATSVAPVARQAPEPEPRPGLRAARRFCAAGTDTHRRGNLGPGCAVDTGCLDQRQFAAFDLSCQAPCGGERGERRRDVQATSTTAVRACMTSASRTAAPSSSASRLAVPAVTSGAGGRSRATRTGGAGRVGFDEGKTRLVIEYAKASRPVLSCRLMGTHRDRSGCLALTGYRY